MAKYGSSPKSFVSVNATSGMMVYCATAPRKMSLGRFIKLRTSSMVMVRPMDAENNRARVAVNPAKKRGNEKCDDRACDDEKRCVCR